MNVESTSSSTKLFWRVCSELSFLVEGQHIIPLLISINCRIFRHFNWFPASLACKLFASSLLINWSGNTLQKDVLSNSTAHARSGQLSTRPTSQSKTLHQRMLKINEMPHRHFISHKIEQILCAEAYYNLFYWSVPEAVTWQRFTFLHLTVGRKP